MDSLLAKEIYGKELQLPVHSCWFGSVQGSSISKNKKNNSVDPVARGIVT